jgi:hypothetical protein
MKKLLILLCFVLLVPFTAKSQLSVVFREYFPGCFIGLTGGISLTSHTGSVLLFDKRDDCDPYSFNANSAYQANVLFGLKLDYKFSRSFYFYSSLLYENRSAKFDPIDYRGPVYDSITGIASAYFKQELDAKINVFSITPMIKYRPFNFDFSILFGPSVVFIVSDELDSKEYIIEPEELFYKGTDTRERTIYSGEIESKKTFLLDLKFGLSYGYMLTERLKLSPEIFYVLPLMNVSEGDWKISSIQFLLSLSYGL